MESHALNPLYKEMLMAYAKRTTDSNAARKVVTKMGSNPWKKVLIAVMIVSLMLITLGVPLYSLLLSVESNALPGNLGSIGNVIETNTVNIANTGNIIGYELWHWGALPSANTLSEWVADGLASLGLGALAVYAFNFALYILSYIIAGFSIDSFTIVTAMRVALMAIGIGADPATLAVLSMVAISIAGA